MSSCILGSSSSLAVRVLMSAADSEPTAICSAPFFGSLIKLSMRSYRFLVTLRRLRVLVVPVNQFLNLTVLGVPR